MESCKINGTWPENFITYSLKCDVSDKVIKSFLWLVPQILRKKEIDIIEKRFRDKRTLRDIAEDYNVTTTVIGQQIQKAIFKIKRKKFLISNGICSYDDVYGNERYNIEYLNLSTRAYNVLGRNGIKDIRNIKTKKQLETFIHCGKKTVEEIKREMNRVGIEVTE